MRKTMRDMFGIVRLRAGQEDIIRSVLQHHDTLATNGERRLAHLSFNVVRLRSAKMMPRMRNLVMTLGSLQPMSSKW